MLGIGIIGGGRICGAHASAAAALPETRLTGIAETDPERLAAAMQLYRCPGWSDYRELLTDETTDAVVVLLPHHLHLEAALAALRAGKHVLLEKPMALTVAECDAILAAAAEAGRTVMVGHIHQFFPHNTRMRELIATGAIGTPILATDTWYKPYWEGKRPQWFLEDACGGGMWPMNAPHMVDRLSFFLNERVVAVKGRVANPTFGLSSDMGAAYLEFASGTPALLAHAGYREGVERFEAEVMGTEGQLRLCFERGGRTLWRSREGRWVPEEVPTPPLPLRPGCDAPSQPFAAQLREFALAVLESRPPAVPGEYGRYIVQVVEACVESSRTGREVRLAG